MNTLTIRPITSTDAAYAQVFALRDEVLRRPLGMALKNDDLTLDHIDTILTGNLDGAVIACLMLHHVDEAQLQLRQMAVAASCQGRGYGRELVIAAEGIAQAGGYRKIILHARKTAVGFYQSLGYSITTGEFTEVSIPHVMMEKALIG